MLLEAMQIPLSAFQAAGGLVLLLFALTMIFGESKPEQEMKMKASISELAVYPLAVPSIASPGAMMAIVLLTDNHRLVLPIKWLRQVLCCRYWRLPTYFTGGKSHSTLYW
ncbi:multiple antibiotic resistance (MarC)-like protein [Actinobacillus equuli]|nr:multiple antibiotic resistance (MarC)-like protein [Actinobacillus equuli]